MISYHTQFDPNNNFFKEISDFIDITRKSQIIRIVIIIKIKRIIVFLNYIS